MKKNVLTPCAAPLCRQWNGSHLLMCRSHWFALPQNIKDAIYSSHRNMQDGKGARDWLITRERARLFIAVKENLPDVVIEGIEAEIERLEAVKL